MPKDKSQSVAFWDAHAPWQEMWLAHCQYHRDIIPMVTAEIRPGWRVLDIGAGSGVLAVALQQQRCQVTALEPSRGMRALLQQTLCRYPQVRLTIDSRCWEEIPLSQLRGYHLMVACNSLQVTSWGFAKALNKIFRAGPLNVCVISETHFIPANLSPSAKQYRLQWCQQLVADSSMAYHSLRDVWKHFHHNWGRPPTPAEQVAIKQELIYHQNHWWLPQQTNLTIWWWRRQTVAERLDLVQQDCSPAV